MQRMAVLRSASFRDGSKTAVMAPATSSDRYQISNTWHRVGDYSAWQHNAFIKAVGTGGGRHLYHLGEVVQAQGVDDWNNPVILRIMSMKMVQCARLTEPEIISLGYATRADYMEEFGEAIEKRRAWYMTIELE